MVCNKCGSTVPDNSKFCEFCGNVINNDTNLQKTINSNENNNKKRLLLIVIFIVIFLGSFILVMNIYNKQKNENNSNQETQNDEFKNIRGNWVTQNNTSFVFNEDNVFYWYKDSDDLNDNYYKGNMEILRGNEALEDLGISYDRVLDVFIRSEGEIELDDIYSVKLYPTYLISGGVDKTETNIPEGSYFKLLFINMSDTESQAYNYNSYDTYYMSKKES